MVKFSSTRQIVTRIGIALTENGNISRHNNVRSKIASVAVYGTRLKHDQSELKGISLYYIENLYPYVALYSNRHWNC
jgi:hypothetical protein